MTADAAAAEPMTSNDTTSDDLAGEHVTGDENPPRTADRIGKGHHVRGTLRTYPVRRRLHRADPRSWPCRAGLPHHPPRHRIHPGAAPRAWAARPAPHRCDHTGRAVATHLRPVPRAGK